MPTYEYLCTMCADQFEVVQKFSDPALKICNQCGALLQKIYQSPGVLFRGSGWHSKDYGR